MRIIYIAALGLMGCKKEAQSQQTPSKTVGMKPVVSTKRALILDGEEQDGNPPKGPNVGTKRAEADKKKQTEQTGVDSFIDFETARQLQEVIDSFQFPNHDRAEFYDKFYDMFNMCFTNREAIIDGEKVELDGNFRGVYQNKQLRLVALYFIRVFVQGARIQEELRSVEALQDKINGVYRAVFPEENSECSDYFVFDENYGSTIVSPWHENTGKEVALQVAARGLEILKALHSVGLVNGALMFYNDGKPNSELVWFEGKPESLRLLGFLVARLYVDAHTKKRRVSTCEQNSRWSVHDCPAPVADLTQFSVIVSWALKDHPLSVAFKNAVDGLEVDKDFDYDKWINAFKSGKVPV